MSLIPSPPLPFPVWIANTTKLSNPRKVYRAFLDGFLRVRALVAQGEPAIKTTISIASLFAYHGAMALGTAIQERHEGLIATMLTVRELFWSCCLSTSDDGKDHTTSQSESN